jgi:hypothetical protein
VQLRGRTQEGGPATGTRLRLEHTDYQGTLDSEGHWRVPDLLPGPYRVLVLDSTMARIDVALDAQVDFVAARDSLVAAEFVVPMPLDYARALCGAEPSEAISRYDPERDQLERIPRQRDRSVAFFVYVTTPDGAPAPSVKVTESVVRADLPPKYHEKSTGGRTDSGGRYFSCWNYHVGESVQLWTRADGQEPQLTLLPMSTRVRAIKVIVPSKR